METIIIKTIKVRTGFKGRITIKENGYDSKTIYSLTSPITRLTVEDAAQDAKLLADDLK